MSKSDLDFSNFRKLHREALEKEYPGRTQAFWGKQESKIVIVGQAPSQSGIKYQKPWFDKSGQKIRDSWLFIEEDLFYNQDLFYLTALGLYFPGKDKKSGDLKPSIPWAEKWLRNEIEYLSPDMFIIVGGMAANFFFPKSNYKDLIFNDQTLRGKPAFVLPHPSPLNVKWFKDNPEFEERIIYIRKMVHSILDI